MGLDLSLTGTGIAVVEPGVLVTMKLVGTSSKDGDDVERADYIADKINRVHRILKPDIVVIEDYAHSRPTNQSRLGELGGIVKRDLWQVCGVAPGTWHEVTSSTVKLFITGNGRASKPDMVLAALGYVQSASPKKLTLSGIKLVRNDNVADAIALARYGLHHFA